MTINRRTIIGLCVYLFIQIPLLIIGSNRIVRPEEAEEKKLEIKQGKYTLYNHADGNKVGVIAIKRDGDSYFISLEGNAYSYSKKYSGEIVSYDSIGVNDAALSVEVVKNRKILRGKAGDNEIIVMKYTDSKYLFADTIYDEYKIYYFVLALAPDALETLIEKSCRKSSNLNHEVINSENSIYKACFIWP